MGKKRPGNNRRNTEVNTSSADSTPPPQLLPLPPLPPLPELPPLPPVPPVPPLPLPTTTPSVPPVCLYPEMEPAVYKAERDALLALVKENTAQHDKAILQLAAGALALTVTFLTDIAKNPIPGTYLWLALGWIFLVVSLICIVASFVTGQHACWAQVRILETHFSTQTRPSQENKYATITHWLNSTGFATFVIGVICILVFSWQNLGSEHTKKKEKKERSMSNQEGKAPASTTKTLGEGYVPQSSPVTINFVNPPRTNDFGIAPPSSPVNVIVNAPNHDQAGYVPQSSPVNVARPTATPTTTPTATPTSTPSSTPTNQQ